MKKLAFAAAFALTATTVTGHAGGMAPMMDEEVVIIETSSSNGGILVPILALILFAGAMSR
ncbi:MAG: hypothetical protein AAFN09_01440 [Pseudomonadota bacterium]